MGIPWPKHRFVQAPSHSMKFKLVPGWAFLGTISIYKFQSWRIAGNEKQNSPSYRFEFYRGSKTPGMDETDLYWLAGLSIGSA